VGTLQILTVQLGAERYGIDIRDIQEVLVAASITPLPLPDPQWSGLVNLRGRLLAVLDLRQYLGLANSGNTASPKEKKIVVLDGNSFQLGLVVDDVQDIVPVDPAEIQPGLEEADTPEQKIIRGISPQTITILNIEEMMRDPRLSVHDSRPVSG
jgi:purine-binding chemotaxis protein CheW